MILRNLLNFIIQFLNQGTNKLRNFYFNSSYYDKKISKINYNNLIYKPSPHLLSSIIKYQKKKLKIEDFTLDNLWHNKNISKILKDYQIINYDA